MQPRILRGLVAHAALFLFAEDEVSRRELDSGADAVAVRLRADQKDLQPVIRIPSIVSQQLRRLAAVVHEDVEISIVVEVADGSAPAHARQLKIRTKTITHVFE